MTLYKRTAERKILRHTYHCAVNGGVAVRMIPTKHVTDCGRRLAEGLVVRQMVLIHCPENATLTRLHAVPYIGQRPRCYYRHGVFNEGLLQLMLHIYINNFLILERQILMIFHDKSTFHSHILLCCNFILPY